MQITVPDIVPLLQPGMTGMCGQVSLAMAAGVSIDEATRAVGISISREVGSSADDLMRGGRKLGLRLGRWYWFAGKKKDRRQRVIERLPERAIMSITYNGTMWGHWVLLWDGFVYDPGIGWPIPVRVYEDTVLDRAYTPRWHSKPNSTGWRKKRKAYWDDVIPILGRKESPELRAVRATLKKSLAKLDVAQGER